LGGAGVAALRCSRHRQDAGRRTSSRRRAFLKANYTLTPDKGRVRPLPRKCNCNSCISTGRTTTARNRHQRESGGPQPRFSPASASPILSATESQGCDLYYQITPAACRVSPPSLWLRLPGIWDWSGFLRAPAPPDPKRAARLQFAPLTDGQVQVSTAPTWRDAAAVFPPPKAGPLLPRKSFVHTASIKT